jgi:hypothetical protein
VPPVTGRVWRWLFYGGLVAISAIILAVPGLPQAGAGRIARNSEAFVLALLLAGWIEFARPRLAACRWRWPITLAAAAACAAVATFLLLGDQPARLRTLNESFLAIALLLPFLQRRSVLAPRIAVMASLGVLAVMVAGSGIPHVVGAAETMAVLVLAFPGLWIVDRHILDGHPVGLTALQLIWYAVLVAAPLAFSMIASAQFGGPLGDVAGHGVRTIEAFACMLLVEIYFTVRSFSSQPRRRS